MRRRAKHWGFELPEGGRVYFASIARGTTALIDNLKRLELETLRATARSRSLSPSKLCSSNDEQDLFYRWWHGGARHHIALIEALQQLGWECEYVGSNKGPEADLIAPLNIPFHSIQSGKLRRYFSWQNFIDPFFIVMGCIQSLWLCLSRKPDVVFSKGGFVAVPIVFAAWICRIPVISHESDITPGLANKLSLPFCRYLCVNFPETLDHLPSRVKSRVVVTGSPLRSGLRDVSAKRGRACLNIDSELPVLFVVGGSLGSMAINQCIWQTSVG